MSLCGLGISCEPAPCPHGKDSRREQCHLCDIHKQIAALIVQVTAQHEFKLHQIDANGKIDKKISSMQVRIYEIENGLIKRIGILGEALHTLSEENNALRKKPHKCPVCHGEIKILIDPVTPMSGIQAMFGKRDENGMYYKDCKSCDGKGIVWG